MLGCGQGELKCENFASSYNLLLTDFDLHFLFVVGLSPVAHKWSDSLLSTGRFGHCDGVGDHLTNNWDLRVFGEPQKKIQKICRYMIEEMHDQT